MKNWNESAIARRDERHTKIDDTPRPQPGNKDTKRWCKGKVGREHTPKCMKHPYAQDLTLQNGSRLVICQGWRVFACTTCGKELATWFGNKEHKPGWVTE